MKKIILSLLAVLATLSIDAATSTVKKNVIEVYKNGSLVTTYTNSSDRFYRAELKKNEDYQNQVLIYKYDTDDDLGSVVATYTNTTDDKYRADLKQKEIEVAETKDGQVVEVVQLWEDGPKFAAVNVGATITDYTGVTLYDKENIGNYYSWGGYEDANENNYTYVSGCLTDIQGSNHDTAKRCWGNNWMMPNKQHLTDLIDTGKTTWTWCDGETTQFEEGCLIPGYKITGIGDVYGNNSIFLPAAGFSDEGVYFNETHGNIGCYWTSTSYNEGGLANGANDLYFYPNGTEVGFSGDYRVSGYSVRAILDENASDPKIWVTNIAISGETSVKVGETIQLTATITPTNAVEKGVTWSTTSSAIDLDSSTGEIKGISVASSVDIMATANDDGHMQEKYTISVVAAE